MSYLQHQIASLLRSAMAIEPVEPYYEVLEYIQIDGTQYFDTGFSPNQDTKAELLFKVKTDLATGFPLFGARESTSSKGFSCQRMGSGYWGGMYGGTITSSTTAVDTNKHLIVRDKNVVYLDGTAILTQSSSTFQVPVSMTLNAMNTNGTIVAQNCVVQYSSFKVWDNGILAYDYIPVLDSQMRPCLYDKVEKTFLYAKNVSDGTTTYDLGFKRWNKFDVDYIESSGTQYIDTGYKFTNTSAFELVCARTGAFVDSSVFCGARNETDTTTNARVLDYSYSAPSVLRGEFILLQRGGYDVQNNVLYIPYDTDFHTYYESPTRMSIDDTDRPTVPELVSPNLSFYIFWQNVGNATAPNKSSIKVKSCKLWDNDTLVRNLKPTVWHNGNTTAVACLYDEVYNKMYTNAGTGSFKAYVAPETTVYTLNDGVQNDDYYLAENGVKTVSADHTSCYSNAFAVKQGDIIEWTVTAEQVSANKRIHGYTTNADIETGTAGSWVQMLAKIVFSTTSDTTQTARFTVPNGINYIRVSHANVRESVCTIKRIRTYEVGKSVSNGQGAGYDLSIPYSNNFVFEAITTCKTTSSNYFMDTIKIISGGSATYQSDTGAFGIGGSSSGATMNWKDGTGNNTIVATDGTNWSRTQGSLPFKYSAKLVGWDENGNHKRTAVFYHFGSGKNSDRVVTNGSNIENNSATVTLLYTTSSNVLGVGSDLYYIYFAQDGVVEYDVIPVRNATVTSDVLLFNRANNTRVARLTITGSPSITFNALD